MNLTVAFLLFIAAMAAALIADLTMLIPLGIGFVLFALVAWKKGFSLRQILSFAASSLKDSLIVVRILLLIGCLTGLWRLSGTVSTFLTLGLALIPQQLFLLSAFLLAAAMSYALGTSFGVTATAGVILMSIARAGGVNPVLAAGAVLSGVYVGDRGSPAASSGNLVAVLTHTDMRKNVRLMLHCSLVPFAVCCAAYGLMSVLSPMQQSSPELMGALAEEFSSHWTCIIPAILIILLPFCGANIRLSMAVSLVSAALVALFVQHSSLPDCLRVMILGYEASDPRLSQMLTGGGIVSMAEVCGILILSCSYGGIFQGAELLQPVDAALRKLSRRIGRFPTMILLGFGVSAVFGNQTVGAIMQANLSNDLYGDSEEEKSARMLDMENSVIVIAGMVPWCIACSVPLAMMGADFRSIPAAFYLWLIPVWWAAVGARRRDKVVGKRQESLVASR